MLFGLKMKNKIRYKTFAICALYSGSVIAWYCPNSMGITKLVDYGLSPSRFVAVRPCCGSCPCSCCCFSRSYFSPRRSGLAAPTSTTRRRASRAANRAPTSESTPNSGPESLPSTDALKTGPMLMGHSSPSSPPSISMRIRPMVAARWPSRWGFRFSHHKVYNCFPNFSLFFVDQRV